MRKKYRGDITFQAEGAGLSGEIVIPAGADSLVLFSHGSGSSRFSPRNNMVAEILQDHGIGTFLFDLLTPEEDKIYSNRFNIEFLTDRLVQVTKYIISLKEFSGLHIGYSGASTGVASALKAAAVLPHVIKAVVSRGGRPDLALDVAARVKAPTLLIAGQLDFDVIRMNREAYNAMRCEKDLKIITGATHLFEEPGTLQQAAELATGWFLDHLVKTKSIIAT